MASDGSNTLLLSCNANGTRWRNSGIVYKTDVVKDRIELVSPCYNDVVLFLSVRAGLYLELRYKLFMS